MRSKALLFMRRYGSELTETLINRLDRLGLVLAVWPFYQRIRHIII